MQIKVHMIVLIKCSNIYTDPHNPSVSVYTSQSSCWYMWSKQNFYRL